MPAVPAGAGDLSCGCTSIFAREFSYLRMGTSRADAWKTLRTSQLSQGGIRYVHLPFQHYFDAEDERFPLQE